MGISGWIDDDEPDPLVASGLHAVDQFAFVVALEALKLDS
jgi:hypothetical protein